MILSSIGGRRDEMNRAADPADPEDAMPDDQVEARMPLPGAASPAPGGPILVALLEELAQVASEEQARAFLGALGKRIALAHPLDRPNTLAALEAQANMIWGQLGWGRTRLVAGSGGIRISHHGWPTNLAGDHHGLWPRAFPMLLAALYQAWFQSLGEPEDLDTHIVSHNRELIELRHGPR
ncbi:hypothetical protein CLG96_05140 [Sphingomonas oleivorans]|uniref:Uncharacterized protein n=1 Tax=Sphingomonas oleivorans TaxID=1735121 RepID=A0A2T5G2V1_9SPHN|nr:hypothetical protein [Sphingomonas oleivorans]PTQ13474.1 hypothetical protein CLG96_05140 [Sphingomonas oleivorans]